MHPFKLLLLFESLLDRPSFILKKARTTIWRMSFISEMFSPFRLISVMWPKPTAKVASSLSRCSFFLSSSSSGAFRPSVSMTNRKSYLVLPISFSFLFAGTIFMKTPRVHLPALTEKLRPNIELRRVDFPELWTPQTEIGCPFWPSSNLWLLRFLNTAFIHKIGILLASPSMISNDIP